MEPNKPLTPEEIVSKAQGIQFTEIVSTGIGPDAPKPNIPIGNISDNNKWGRAYQVAKALAEKLAVDTLEKFYSTVEEIYKQL